MRYFLEVSYKGTHFSGFQIQPKGNTIQGELEKALFVYYRQEIKLTGSSRTDAGVHALQNFFQADVETLDCSSAAIYHLNAILPADIVLHSIRPVLPEAHCRFSATARSYQYFVYFKKNPFLKETAWYYPYPLEVETMQSAAALLLTVEDFTSFSKRNSQTFTNYCQLYTSRWQQQGPMLVYEVEGNRFLRGMVRALTSTMLQVGRGNITLSKFQQIIEAKDCTQADFSAPARGLHLCKVHLPKGIFEN